jgi:hypothetical protein
MEPSNWLERYLVLLPIVMLTVILLAVGDPHSSLGPWGWGWLLTLLTSPVMLAGSRQLYRSRDGAAWSAVRWLPLRGRWLCYFMSVLLALPATLVILLTGVGLLMTVFMHR